MPSKPPSNDKPQLNRLVPQRIADLLGEAPVLPFENVEGFNALYAELLVTYDPKDFIEHMRVRDIAELWWDIKRYRNMRRAAIENRLPNAAAQLMAPELKDLVDGENDSENYMMNVTPLAQDILRRAARGSEEHRKIFKSVVSQAGVTDAMLSVHAYAGALPTIAALESAIIVSERKLEQVIHHLEERRKTIAAMTRSFGGASGSVIEGKANAGSKS